MERNGFVRSASKSIGNASAKPIRRPPTYEEPYALYTFVGKTPTAKMTEILPWRWSPKRPQNTPQNEPFKLRFWEHLKITKISKKMCFAVKISRNHFHKKSLPALNLSSKTTYPCKSWGSGIHSLKKDKIHPIYTVLKWYISAYFTFSCHYLQKYWVS